MVDKAARGRRSAGTFVLAFLLVGPVAGPPRAAAQSLDAIPTLVLFTPSSVEVAPDDTLWIADRYLPRIAHTRQDGSPLSVFSTSRFGGGPPAGVTQASGSGYLFVSDPQIPRIVRVDFAGNAAGEFGTSALGIPNPADLAFDSRDGTLFVADPTARAIFHLAIQDANLDGNPDAASLLDSFSTIPLGLDNPMGIALDPATGHLYLSDPALDRVFEIAPPGTVVSSFDSGYYGGTSVTGLAWDSASSRLRLADAGRKILTVSTAGAPLGRIATAPFGSLSPQGIAWDPSSSTLLVVSGERKLLQFQREPPDADGTVGGIYLWRQQWTSTFTSIAPSGIALDASGTDRFVVDGGQDRVFQVNPMGVVMSSFNTAGAGSTSPTGVAQGPGGNRAVRHGQRSQESLPVHPLGGLGRELQHFPFKHKPQSEPPSDYPVGIAYDPTRDHFFVADYQARVFEVTGTGSFVASFSTAPSAPYPTDLAVESGCGPHHRLRQLGLLCGVHARGCLPPEIPGCAAPCSRSRFRRSFCGPRDAPPDPPRSIPELRPVPLSLRLGARTDLPGALRRPDPLRGRLVRVELPTVRHGSWDAATVRDYGRTRR
jgi:DNA-binding beta-propeller fold protein YncE